MKHLDLFSGIGGFALGLRWAGFPDPVAFCEIDPWCQKVLKKHWPHVPCYSDVRNIDYEAIGPVDIITGGYPCQPFSTAGKRAGAEDDRHLWPAMLAAIKALRPAWVIGENVAGHISLGLDEVLSDLETEGYACQAFGIPACAVDAGHIRQRIWILAHRSSKRRKRIGETRVGESSSVLRPAFTRGVKRPLPGGHTWEHKPGVGRVVHGVSRRVDRNNQIRGLGNAVVPKVVQMIGAAILDAS